MKQAKGSRSPESQRDVTMTIHTEDFSLAQKIWESMIIRIPKESEEKAYMSPPALNPPSSPVTSQDPTYLKEKQEREILIRKKKGLYPPPHPELLLIEKARKAVGYRRILFENLDASFTQGELENAIEEIIKNAGLGNLDYSMMVIRERDHMGRRRNEAMVYSTLSEHQIEQIIKYLRPGPYSGRRGSRGRPLSARTLPYTG